MKPHRSLLIIAAGLATGFLQARADDVFDFEMLRYSAKLLAAKPFVQRPVSVPEPLLRLNYDQYRDIRFRPSESLWRRERLPFELQFFHPGFSFDRPVQINIVQGKSVEPVEFSSTLFDYGTNRVPEVPKTMGFAGFRVLYALNKPGDELGSFLGVSYFRFLCQHAFYGLSARGLAINTGEPGGEEFPVFREF